MAQSMERGNPAMERNTWPAGSDGMQIHDMCAPSSGSQRRMRSIHSNVVGIARNHRQRLHTSRQETRTKEPRTTMPSYTPSRERSLACTPREQDRERHLVHEHVTPFYNIPATIGPSWNRKAISPSGSRDEQVNDRRGFWTEKNETRRKFGTSSETWWSVEATTPSSDTTSSPVTSLPFDVLQRIAGSFSWQDLWSATCTCKTWSKALSPLREGMLFLHWGKKFKHGHGVAKSLENAMQSFTKGAVRGCAPAMVDAGLLLWEMASCRAQIPGWNVQLGSCLLARLIEAVKWLKAAAKAGHVRAQYSLALCLQQGRGVECNVQKAAWWYLQAAEGGSSRAMYNSALCLRSGDGVARNLYEAKRWMRRAAMAGHGKAQFEHGLTLFAEGEGGSALVFLELATRAGETGATHIRDALLVQLNPRLRAHALACADNFQSGSKWQR